MAEVQQQDTQEKQDPGKSVETIAEEALLKKAGLPERRKEQDGENEFSPAPSTELSEEFAQSFLEGDEKLQTESAPGRPVNQFLNEFKQLADLLLREKRLDPSEISYQQQEDGSIHVTWKSGSPEEGTDPLYTTYRVTDSAEFRSMIDNLKTVWQNTLEALKDPELSQPRKDGRRQVALIGTDLRFRTFVQGQDVIESTKTSPEENTSEQPEASPLRPTSEFFGEFKQLADFLVREYKIGPEELTYKQQPDGTLHVTWFRGFSKDTNEPLYVTHRVTDSEKFRYLSRISQALWKQTLDVLKDPDTSQAWKDGKHKATLMIIEDLFRNFVDTQEIVGFPKAPEIEEAKPAIKQPEVTEEQSKPQNRVIQGPDLSRWDPTMSKDRK